MKALNFLTKRINLIFVLLLIFLSLGHFVFALRTDNYFSTDDFNVLAYFKNNSLLDVFNFPFTGDIFGFKKMLGYLVFGTLVKVVGTNAFWFNVLIFLLNTLNLVVLYKIVVKLTKNNLVGFLMSVILNKYYLFYFSNVHEYLVVLFSLLTIYLFITKPDKWYYFITYILALLSKESSFTLPLVLLTIVWVGKPTKNNFLILFKKLTPMFVTSVTFVFYQWFSFGENIRGVNDSYKISFSLERILKNLLMFIDIKLIIFALLVPFLVNRKKYLVIFFAALITLIPAGILINRNELYYVYLPISYILIYLSLVVPKGKSSLVAFFLVLFVVFGGRLVLPRIAWTKFPNWQKQSIEKVLQRVDDNVDSQKEIDISDINLERDARLMLESGTIDLFLSSEKSDKYDFIYDHESDKIIVVYD